jgi:hypothetical protein
VARKGTKKQAGLELERERMHRRYDLAKWTLPPLIWIVSTYVPLKAIAGHKTTLSVTLSITIAFSFVTSAALVAMYIRVRKAETRMGEMRKTIDALEGSRRAVRA